MTKLEKIIVRMASEDGWEQERILDPYYSTAFQAYAADAVIVIGELMNPSPEMLVAAWKAFSRGRQGMPFLRYLGEGPAFKEAMIAMLQSALTE